MGARGKKERVSGTWTTVNIIKYQTAWFHDYPRTRVIIDVSFYFLNLIVIFAKYYKEFWMQCYDCFFVPRTEKIIPSLCSPCLQCLLAFTTTLWFNSCINNLCSDHLTEVFFPTALLSRMIIEQNNPHI